MIKNVKSYFERLESLSTEDLDHSTEKLVRAEKRNVALVIAHIAEMSRRKGHLECGYKNLFDYCVRRLRLSEGSVALRIQVANVSRRFPELLEALARNRMSLTVAGLLAPVLTESNLEKLLSDCAGMTKREAETPRSGPRPAPRVSPSILEPARPDVFNFRFAADRKFKDKFERLAEVLGVENPLHHMAEIMEQALDIALDKRDVKRKRARRLQRVSKGNKKSRPDEQGRRLRPALSGEKLPELIKGLSVKAPAAKPRSTIGALMPQDELGSEPAPYHWRGFERKHSPGSES